MKARYIIIPITVITVLIASALSYAYYIIMYPQTELEDTTYIYIYPHDTSESIIEKLENIDGVKCTKGFKIIAAYNNFDRQKRTGRYAIYDKDNMRAIYRRIVSNQQTPVKITLPAARTIEQFIAAAGNQLMIDSVELIQLVMQPTLYDSIGYTKETLPSLFLPNTYEVYWNISTEQFMQRMIKEHRAFWSDSRLAKAKAIGLTPEEVSTLASIVDEETNNHEEKPMVAGVYINRLKRGMLLQADPTVKYAIGDFTRKRILNDDLNIESPYNTYRYKGLPPGPIRIPTLQAIESVLNYTKHNYIYMCAKEDFSGKHNFATNLASHNANARRYQQALNKLRIKR
ncbi:MAG: endolytic transglycosylase MltG [Bacteroidaceae bacterium]|nr:endolytic transglycosylase MltG [Bacteroidaceae bacterium]